MKAVFDTNVLLSSTLWDWSVSQKLLHKMIFAEASIFSSSEIVDEYLEILQRDFKYTEEQTKEKITIMFSFLTFVKPIEELYVVKDDPEDNKIIECAAASDSEYIITYDTHLLALKEFRKIKIVTPEDMIKIMDSSQ